MCDYLDCTRPRKGENDFCGRHIKLGAKLKNPELYCSKKNCCCLKEENSVKCKRCIANYERAKKKRDKGKVGCNYPDCKNKSQKDEKFCKLHKRMGAKLKNPELYCSREGCSGPRKEGYVRCEKCIKSSQRLDEKRKKIRERTSVGKCKKCGEDIENYKTNTDAIPQLCKKHYFMGIETEKKRLPRDRNWPEELKNFKVNHPEKYKKMQEWRAKYHRTIDFKLIDMKCKAKSIVRREIFISDQWMKLLFTSNCFYCGQSPDEHINGIDRKDNNEPYTYENSVACCPMCNFMKKAYTQEGFIRKCKQIADFQKTKENI